MGSLDEGKTLCAMVTDDSGGRKTLSKGLGDRPKPPLPPFPPFRATSSVTTRTLGIWDIQTIIRYKYR